MSAIWTALSEGETKESLIEMVIALRQERAALRESHAELVKFLEGLRFEMLMASWTKAVRNLDALLERAKKVQG